MLEEYIRTQAFYNELEKISVSLVKPALIAGGVGGLVYGGSKFKKHIGKKEKAIAKEIGISPSEYDPTNPEHIKKLLDARGIKYTKSKAYGRAVFSTD